MKYIVTGCDGQLGGRVAANMIKEVPGQDLIFTYMWEENVTNWKQIR